jgi:hypothetical protein
MEVFEVQESDNFPETGGGNGFPRKNADIESVGILFSGGESITRSIGVKALFLNSHRLTVGQNRSLTTE